MPNPYFAFKQFTVYHNHCAMKVGTDACLLGAWATHPSPKRILDIGTGSGVIALMLAQRYTQAHIEAIEIESDCANQCASNFIESPFSNRIACHHISLQDYQPAIQFDLIVSNPPYFSNSFKPDERGRLKARHDDSLTPTALFSHAKQLLAPNGVICIIIPVDREDDYITCAHEQHLYLAQRTAVRPTPEKLAKRVLLSFNAEKNAVIEDEFYVESKRGAYSERFKHLLSNFYLYL